MEKLVELLNKFEKEKTISEWLRVDEDDEYFWRSIEDWEIVNWSYDRDAHGFMKYYIISKDFEFIKWLVDKDKIDLEWFEYSYYFKIKDNSYCSNKNDILTEHILIMLLSIAENPIDLLISFLK